MKRRKPTTLTRVECSVLEHYRATAQATKIPLKVLVGRALEAYRGELDRLMRVIG